MWNHLNILIDDECHEFSYSNVFSFSEVGTVGGSRYGKKSAASGKAASSIVLNNADLNVVKVEGLNAQE